MAIKILVPELGESVLDATVSRWLKKQGDFVNVGEVLVELETDKVNLEVGAKGSGVLQKIDVPEGKDVKVGDVLGTIEEKAEEPKGSSAPTPKATEEIEVEKEEETVPVASNNDKGEAQRQTPPPVTPVASRLARANDVDLSKVSGTGSEGRVTKADVELFLQGQEKEKDSDNQVPAEAEREAQPVVSATTTPSSERGEERTRMSRRRRTIAQRLLEASQSTAMLTTFNEIDMGAVMDIRSRRNEEFQKRFGIKLGFTSFFVKASVSALKAFPQINAEIDGEDIVFKHYYDIGTAIGSSEGLVVPVIRDADKLSFAEIEKQVKDFVAKTDQGKLSIEDLRGGTFTITNGGVFGSLMSTPILNPPQVGILGLHKIEERPIAQNGQVVIRPMMYVALSYDHRIVDGREAVQFLVHIKQLLEDPAWMLVEG
ncbi:MAG TPA: 2-oxoglutarate dehydrogenase complex dihydrolipoyllysine-residue succinyltransferase [Anaerolineales bacterium]|nr:2-oxoglutarate dehydrogenase complex dihydrolipoyllysine-residue succinyltransferase [Anaerolineales bacterium]